MKFIQDVPNSRNRQHKYQNWEVDEIHPRYQYMNFTDTLKGLL